jgi:hypothetical protein
VCSAQIQPAIDFVTNSAAGSLISDIFNYSGVIFSPRKVQPVAHQPGAPRNP